MPNKGRGGGDSDGDGPTDQSDNARETRAKAAARLQAEQDLKDGKTAQVDVSGGSRPIVAVEAARGDQDLGGTVSLHLGGKEWQVTPELKDGES